MFFPDLVALFGNPAPRTKAAEGQTRDQECQRPRISCRVVFIEPKTYRCTDQGRNGHGPSHKPHHAKPKPNPRRRIAFASDFAVRLLPDLGRKPRFFVARFIGHAQTPPCVPKTRLQAFSSLCASFALRRRGQRIVWRRRREASRGRCPQSPAARKPLSCSRS